MTCPTTRDELISCIAKGAWLALDEASATIKALEDAGLVVVPREPTANMRRAVAVNWGRTTWAEFGDVIAASPFNV